MAQKRTRPRYQKVRNRRPTGPERESLLDVLADARDEAPLQAFLDRNPAFLARLLPMGSDVIVYDRPRLGAEYIPDFLMSTRNSQGVRWACVELESPAAKAVTRAGNMSATLGGAVRQVNDWRDWLEANGAYARGELGLAGISGALTAYVVIGRREAMNDRQRKRYAALDRMGFSVLSYDRLLEA